jgi:hypothetical protein
VSFSGSRPPSPGSLVDEKRRSAIELTDPEDAKVMNAMLACTVGAYGVAWPIGSVAFYRFMAKREPLKAYSPLLRGAVAAVVGFFPPHWISSEIIECACARASLQRRSFVV